VLGYDGFGDVDELAIVLNFLESALKAFLGLGKPSGSFEPTVSNILIFAFLLATLFLGTVSTGLLGFYLFLELQ